MFVTSLDISRIYCLMYLPSPLPRSYFVNWHLFCFRKEGIAGLYKGMTPYLVHVMPNICLVFLIYEKIANG